MELGERFSRRFGIGRETLPMVRNWSGDPPGGPELVGKPSRRCGSIWDNRPEFRKWSRYPSKFRNWSGDPTGGPEVDGRSFHSYGSSRKALPEVQTARETLPEVRNWLGDPP